MERNGETLGKTGIFWANLTPIFRLSGVFYSVDGQCFCNNRANLVGLGFGPLGPPQSAEPHHPYSDPFFRLSATLCQAEKCIIKVTP